MSIRMALQYIITSPCFHHSFENIPYSTSHNPHVVPILLKRLVSSRAQERLCGKSCPPSLARIMRHGRANHRARLSPSPANMQISALISSLTPVHMSNVLLLYWHPCRTVPRPIHTSNITLGYKSQTPPTYNTNPSNATLPPPPHHKRSLNKEQLREPLTAWQATPTLRQPKREAI